MKQRILLHCFHAFLKSGCCPGESPLCPEVRMFIGCSIMPEGTFVVATSTHDEYGCSAEFGALGTWDDKKDDVVLRQG